MPPPEWEAVEDPGSGNTYYVNSLTGEATWDAPIGFSEGAALVDLPAGWQEVHDESTGKKYFHNPASGETSWDVPTHMAGMDSEEHMTFENPMMANKPPKETSSESLGHMAGGVRLTDMDPKISEMHVESGASPVDSVDKVAEVEFTTTDSSSSMTTAAPVTLPPSTPALAPSDPSSTVADLSEPTSAPAIAPHIPAPKRALMRTAKQAGQPNNRKRTFQRPLAQQASKAGKTVVEEEDKLPDENDTSFAAKVSRYRLFEKKAELLETQASNHYTCITQAFEADSSFMRQAVRLAGSKDAKQRKTTVSAWSGAVACRRVSEAYALEVERSIINNCRLASQEFAIVNAAIAENDALNKEYAHYVSKVGELKLSGGKHDKKLQRNEEKLTESMKRLESSTQKVVDLLNSVEQRREALVTIHARHWLQAQREHLPDLHSKALAASMGDDIQCTVEGLEREQSAGSEADASSAMPKGADASTWTAISHRMKYGAAANFDANDSSAHAFNEEVSLYAKYETSVPTARSAAALFVDTMGEAMASRADVDETLLVIAALPRGGDDVSRVASDRDRYKVYDMQQVTIEMVTVELEERRDADIEVENLGEQTKVRYLAEVLRPLDETQSLFGKKTVQEMIKERPKLVANVNHYLEKVEGLEKAVADAKKKLDSTDKGVVAAIDKLKANEVKLNSEQEKLKRLSQQLTSSFRSTEDSCAIAAVDSANAAKEIKGYLCEQIAAEALLIMPKPLFLGARRSDKGRKKPYCKEKFKLLRQGLDIDQSPLKLNDLRYEQATAVQAYTRRFIAAKRVRRQAKEMKRLKREAEEKRRKEAEEARIQKEEEERRKREEAEERRREEEERRLEERRQRERREREEREREEMAEGVSKYGLEGGGSVELNKKLVKTLSALEESRKTLKETEEALDEASHRAKKSAKLAKAQGSELVELKARYNSQRLINAKLMLEIQSLKGNIQVCCRIRPFNNTETERGDEPAVELITETEVGVYNGGADWETYGFDQVWGAQSSQAQIFEQVEALALSVVEGYNACICCYGQTGSGKTFTMTGLPREGKPGISFQTMDKIFETLELKAKTAAENADAAELRLEAAAERKRNGGASRPPPPAGSASEVTSFEWRAEVSMLEIYNEKVRCLLAPAPSKKESDQAKSKLDIKQGANGLMTVPGLVSQPVEDTNGVLDAFEQGNATRSVTATAMNATSSRSHMVLMVDVATRTNGGAEVMGRLYLVDLAGSERVAKSGVTGQAMKEAQGINKSLSALGDVMEALDKGQGHVPFRNSKLTFLLQSALGGSARCMFIFNASPARGNSDETRCTFKFASRMRNISLGAAKKNVDSSGLEGALMKAKGDAAQLKAEFMELKKSGAGKADSSSSSKGGAKGSDAGAASAAALAEVQKRLLAKEEQVETIKDENALLRSQLAAAERKANDLAASALANAEAAPLPPKPTEPTPPSAPASRHESVVGYRVGDRVMVRDAGEAWEWGTVETIEFDEPLVRKDGWDKGDSYFWKEMRYPTAAELAAGSDHSDDSSDSDQAGGGAADDSSDSDDSDSESENEVAAPAPRRRPSGVSGVASSGGGRGGAAKVGLAARQGGWGKTAAATSKSPVRSMIRN